MFGCGFECIAMGSIIQMDKPLFICGNELKEKVNYISSIYDQCSDWIAELNVLK